MPASTPKLFEATRIKNLHLRNRLVRSATWEGMHTENGCPSASLRDYYRQLARGGVGLLISGFTYVSADGKPLPGAMSLHHDGCAAEIRALVAAVHDEGAKICVQLGHAGGQTRTETSGIKPLAPSAVAAPQYHPETPREMDWDDIERIIAAFAAAACRAREYGFDAVQLHAAHGYLINQFLSPHTNRRSDAYGGSLAHRQRFLLEVCARTRAALGGDFPLFIKLTGSDHLADGLSRADALLVAKALDAQGVDLIEVSGGTPASGELGPVRRQIDTPEKEAYNLPLARAIKQVVNCPVMVVGGIRRRETAVEIIQRRDADFIALSRPLIRQPDLPRRWHDYDGPAETSCIYCNHCFKAAFKGSLCCMRIKENNKTSTG